MGDRATEIRAQRPMGRMREMGAIGHVLRRGRTVVSVALLLALLIAVWPPHQAAAANERWCPPESYGICTENAFLDFWRANGALDILGYPLDPARRTPEGMTFQIYERAILEWHPEFPLAYQVSLARLGAVLVDGIPQVKQRAAEPPVPCAGECALFEQTRHTLRGDFLRYWTAYGGLAVFGFPLTEQFEERNEADGKTYLVQYFERNRFELHPENQGKYRVLLGRLGAEFLKATGAEIKSWPTAAVPNYGETAPAPAPQVAMTVAPTAGPPGTEFVVRATGLPAGAAVTSAITNQAGQTIDTKTFQLNPGETSLTITIVDTGNDPPGAYTVTFVVAGRAVGRASFTITAPTTTDSDRALMRRAVELVYSVPDARYIIDTLGAREVTWRIVSLPETTAGYYDARANMITYNAMFRAQDPHNLAAVVGHEGQHAYDFFRFGPPRTEVDCYEFELRGFVVGVALWQAWYGPGGKPNPSNDFELLQNLMLRDLQYNEGRGVIDYIIEVYADQCGPLPEVIDGASVQDTGGLSLGTRDLPLSVVESFPNVDAVLAALARRGPSQGTAPLPIRIKL